jgi:hypothetical protein
MNDLELETLEIILIEREFVCLCVYLFVVFYYVHNPRPRRVVVDFVL